MDKSQFFFVNFFLIIELVNYEISNKSSST
jgi:hypothetical protein